MEVRCAKPYSFCVVYVAPDISVSDLSSLLLYLQDLFCHNNVFHLGDFNMPDVNWSTFSAVSLSSADFCDLVFKLDLATSPTHVKGGILALVFSNSSDNLNFGLIRLIIVYISMV